MYVKRHKQFEIGRDTINKIYYIIIYTICLDMTKYN